MSIQLRIEVTAADIKNGVPGSFSRCPIARAIRRTTGTRQSVRVMSTTWVGHLCYRLPLCAVKFINRFDDDEACKPFVFTMRRS